MIMNVISPWSLTGFYGWPKELRKQESCCLLKHLHSRSSALWLCCGDFNEILSSEQKQGGLPKPLRQMQEFRETLLHSELVELGFSGNVFTWDNGRLGEDFMQERLDRACATLAWRDLFPHAKVTHIQASYLDHVPLLITTSKPTNLGKRKKLPRRFEEKWVSHPMCEEVIWEAWGMEVLNKSPMFILFEKIKKCRTTLVDWSRITFGNAKSTLQEKQVVLDKLSMQNMVEHLQTFNALKTEINTILHQDELFWQQRSRSIWLPTGDKNTKFFHQRASQCRRKNHISGVQDKVYGVHLMTT